MNTNPKLVSTSLLCQESPWIEKFNPACYSDGAESRKGDGEKHCELSSDSATIHGPELEGT